MQLKKRAWFLDPKRKKPVLKVLRQQIPLAPAFAITAHTSQGKTLPAALLDLAIDKRTDPTLGTVAASRVRSRHDVLILRPFPLWLFQRGAPEGPKLLLQSLRGQEVDWQAYREARHPTAVCEKCQHAKMLDKFSDAQWSRVRANLPATCLACVNLGKPKAKAGPVKRKYTPGPASFTCSSCKRAKIQDAFPRAQLNQKDAEAKRRCLTCVRAATVQTCTVCATSKPVADFAVEMITLPTELMVCRACQQAASEGHTQARQGWFTCKGCKGFFREQLSSTQNQQRQFCLNCSSRGTRAVNQHKCRSCGKMFQHAQEKGHPRMRTCTDCRQPARKQGSSKHAK